MYNENKIENYYMKLKINKLKIGLKDSGKEIVSEASFEITQGEIILISGANGSGKSSLLSAIFKHPDYELSCGEIVLEKEKEKVDLVNLQTDEIVKNGLYLSLQNVSEIFGVNLLQFLFRAFKNIYPENNKSVLEFNKELLKYCERFDLSKDFLGRDVNVGMSGGEKKQAEMLHLLALKPKFIFMDEPDSGVDKGAIKKVFQVVEYLQNEHNSAFVIVSHHPNLDEYIKVNKTYEMKDMILSLHNH